jgi:molybdenum cofactor guanylyltransferase/molybdopterin-guanine dinucleotide biosynthesis protein MobB
MTADTAGVLLAGGLSRRMGGGDKGLQLLDGRPLIHYAASKVRTQVATLALNANGDPARFAILGLPVIADATSDFAGPLAGVLAALRWNETPEVRGRAVLTVPADSPFIPADLAARLDAALSVSPEARVAVAASRGRRHHIAGLWRPEAAADIAEALARGERKAETMVDRLGAVVVSFEDVDAGGRSVDPFFNVNTHEDLAQAEEVARLLGGGGPPFVAGVAGWKNSGKTTLVERLVAHFVALGFRVSTVKHTHHDLDPDERGRDSGRHREAGARETAVVAPGRWMLNGVVRDDADLPLAAGIGWLQPVDIVLVEGFKFAPIPKIEVRRRGQGEGAMLSEHDPRVIAVASDEDASAFRVPRFYPDDVAQIADMILSAGRFGVRAA